MGTRSITTIKDNGEIILCLYRQMDGYPEDHGIDLARILVSKKIVNGIPMDNMRGVFNGASDLAVQLITRLKMDMNEYKYPNDAENDERLRSGNLYIISPNEGWNSAYQYVIDVVDFSIRFQLFEDKQLRYDGSPEDYIEYIKDIMDEDI